MPKDLNCRYGALEAGGTKMVCAVGLEDGTILERAVFKTEEPAVTVPRMLDFFKDKGLTAIGIGCFGPIDLDRSSETYGYITTTPKLAWQNYDIVGTFSEALGIPVGFDTDVNAAVLGEAAFGAAKGLKNAIYITVGTGVGVGVLAEGRLLHGMLHPEAGHILVSRAFGDGYRSKCPFHENCLEGLASGPAIEGRYGRPAAELADNDAVWQLEAEYIAQALVNFTLTLSPENIILGGGVMNQTKLFSLIRTRFGELLNGYIKTKEIEDTDSYIVPSSLNGDQGIAGCICLAVNA